MGKQTIDGSHWLAIEVSGDNQLFSSKYILWSAEEINLYRVETIEGWVNYDRIFIFGWTIPLSRISNICRI